ncbi:OmpA family protein [Bradyrhizobium ontarionense]|uniref:OmpA family protein n=1 Tax=Bradyrhizobium ontarionense TaxID=2898149 RepID=A0ABY3RAJ5_9BRAD|nr:OmpA family protein [Bradyrhizobium sp. A19]UFZ03974.1 OmpA family protein [Bradyrhizobium sp. A19]
MLAPSPPPVSPPFAARVEPCTVAGEEAPLWLAAAFAVAGALIAMMSASLWQQGLARPPTVAAMTPVRTVPAREEPAVEAPRRAQETPVPEPAPIVAPPAPAPSVAAVTREQPAPPAGPAAIAEPQSSARNMPAAECFAPLTVAFERGSARPNPADMKRSLAILQRALARHGDVTIVIEGHTDISGSEDLNVLLSYSRAKAIAAQLKHDGIPARRLSVRAAGSGEARGDAGTLAGDRKAFLRIAGLDDCDQLTATKRP